MLNYLRKRQAKKNLSKLLDNPKEEAFNRDTPDKLQIRGNYISHFTVHRIFANLKTWALGVYHGLRRKHLQTYLDEFGFRFNRRRTRHAAFRSLLAIGMSAKPITYKRLTSPEAAE